MTQAGYPAPDWALSMLLRGPSTINVSATAEDTQHRLRVEAATTKDWTPGAYRWALRATRGADVVTIGAGAISVSPDIESMPDGDVRSYARRCLDAIEAVIEKRASIDQKRYVINNRELERTAISDLLKLRDVFRGEVKRENAAACGRNLWGPAAQVRF
ncbi:hypothetical protein D3C87_475260 [compost metagenome]